MKIVFELVIIPGVITAKHHEDKQPIHHPIDLSNHDFLLCFLRLRMVFSAGLNRKIQRDFPV